LEIAKVAAFPVKMTFSIPFSVSTFSIPTVRSHVVVVIHTDEGISGVGETVPTPVFHEETVESILHNIKNYYGPALIGEDPFNVEGIMDKFDRILTGNPFARAAIDFALYDIMGKKTGIPVCMLLGGCYRDRYPVVWAVSLSSKTENIVREVTERVEMGFRTMKIKVGGDPDEDLNRLRIVRETVGSEVAIRVDANQGWTADKAIKIIRKMEKYDLQLVEQPVAAWDLEGMARVAKAIDTPVMADESLFSPQTAMRIIRLEAADILNIKVMKPGGLYNSKKIAMMAEAAGIPCLVGSMIEAGVGTAAGAHFAAANRVVSYPSETIGPCYFETDIVKEDMKPKDGFIRVPTKPGLGVELDYSRIRSDHG